MVLQPHCCYMESRENCDYYLMDLVAPHRPDTISENAVQGFAFADGVDMQPYYRSGYLLANVKQLKQWHPNIYLRSWTTHAEHRFRVLLKEAQV